MTNRADLKPWAVFWCRVSGNICVARFRSRGDAYAYRGILRANNPDKDYEVMFDKQPAEVQG